MCPVFFFQAEDGIRDGRVTGVQTCALPISSGPRRPALELRQRLREPAPPGFGQLAVRAAAAQKVHVFHPLAHEQLLELRRSEERRVGKEGRSRWWPDG